MGERGLGYAARRALRCVPAGERHAWHGVCVQVNGRERRSGSVQVAWFTLRVSCAAFLRGYVMRQVSVYKSMGRVWLRSHCMRHTLGSSTA